MKSLTVKVTKEHKERAVGNIRPEQLNTFCYFRRFYLI
jgi:hypothetical protein